MQTFRAFARLLPGIVLVLACSGLDPRVGARQGKCGVSLTQSGQSTTGSSYPSVGSGQSSATPACEGNTGEPCNDCESAHCCASRSACYGDPVCACADQVLDQCLDEAGTAPMAEAAEQAAGCWRTFWLAGSVEQARITCQRSWCQAECGVP